MRRWTAGEGDAAEGAEEKKEDETRGGDSAVAAALGALGGAPRR